MEPEAREKLTCGYHQLAIVVVCANYRQQVSLDEVPVGEQHEHVARLGVVSPEEPQDILQALCETHEMG